MATSPSQKQSEYRDPAESGPRHESDANSGLSGYRTDSHEPASSNQTAGAEQGVNGTGDTSDFEPFISGSLGQELRQARYLVLFLIVVITVALQVWVLF